MSKKPFDSYFVAEQGMIVPKKSPKMQTFRIFTSKITFGGYFQRNLSTQRNMYLHQT